MPRLTLLLLRLLEHLLDDLLLLDQESTDDAVLDAVCASRSTVGALDGLLGAGDGGIFAGTEGGDTSELGSAVLAMVSKKALASSWGSTYTALGGSALLLDVQVTELTTGSLDDANLLALGVVWRTSPLPIVSPAATAPTFAQSPSRAFRAAMRRTYVSLVDGIVMDFPGSQWVIVC